MTRQRPHGLLRRVLLLIAVPLLLSGCLSASDEGAPLADADGDAGTPDDGATEVLRSTKVLARKQSSGTAVEFSALCTLGEGPELAREALMPPGTQRLRFTVEPGAAAGGIRLGYALDGGDITWLPVVTGMPASFDVDVDVDALETSSARWSFHYQPNLPDPATQPCYTGAAVGAHRLLVEALPAA